MKLILCVLLSLVSLYYAANLNANNVAAGVLYYFDNSDCEGTPKLITTRYLDYVKIHNGPFNISCDENIQCELNYLGQPDAQCEEQLVKLTPVAGSSTQIIFTVATYNATIGGYNQGVGVSSSWNTCLPSRSFLNCYFRALPLAESVE